MQFLKNLLLLQGKSTVKQKRMENFDSVNKKRLVECGV